MIGFLHFWDITIDTISCINIVVAIGLCVDYSAHIAHAFIVAEGESDDILDATAIPPVSPLTVKCGHPAL